MSKNYIITIVGSETQYHRFQSLMNRKEKKVHSCTAAFIKEFFLLIDVEKMTQVYLYLSQFEVEFGILWTLSQGPEDPPLRFVLSFFYLV